MQVDVTSSDRLEGATVKGDLVLKGTNNNLTISDVIVEGNLDLSEFDGDVADLTGIVVEGNTIL